MRYEEIELIDNKERSSFELFVEGKRSFITYQIKDDKVYLLHTEVPAEQEGLGIAACLVEKTFCYLDANKFKILPLCSYVQSYLNRHPEWKRLVDNTEI